MQKRHAIIAKFTTFYQVTTTGRWIVDPVLQDNMNRLVTQYLHQDEKFWVIHFLEASRSDSLAVKHLRAYLEEPCYWGAIEAFRYFTNFGDTQLDYWQIARTIDPVKLLKPYAPEKGIPPQAYAQLRLRYAIFNVIRQGKEIERSSDWGVLFKTGKKALSGYLQEAGFSQAQQSQYLLAWQGFKAVYAPNPRQGNRKLPPPTPEQLEAIADYYHQQPIIATESPVSGQQIKEWLTTCIRVVREATSVQFYSLDVDETVFQSTIADYSENQAEREVESSQNQQQWQEIRAVLEKASANLSDDAQKMLILEYGLTGFNQTEIAKLFGIQQYQVSRQLKRYKRPLIEALIEWSKSQLGVTLSVDAIDDLSKQLEQWLIAYYQDYPFTEFLELILVKELGEEIPWLRGYFSGNLSAVNGAVSLGLNSSETALTEKLARIKSLLQERLHNWMEDALHLPPSSREAIAQPLARLVENWLSNAPYAIFELDRRNS